MTKVNKLIENFYTTAFVTRLSLLILELLFRHFICSSSIVFQILPPPQNLLCCAADVLEGRGIVQVAITVVEVMKFHNPAAHVRSPTRSYYSGVHSPSNSSSSNSHNQPLSAVPTATNTNGSSSSSSSSSSNSSGPKSATSSPISTT